MPKRHPDYFGACGFLNFLENFSRFTLIESFLERAQVVFISRFRSAYPYLLSSEHEGFWNQEIL